MYGPFLASVLLCIVGSTSSSGAVKRAHHIWDFRRDDEGRGGIVRKREEPSIEVLMAGGVDGWLSSRARKTADLDPEPLGPAEAPPVSTIPPLFKQTLERPEWIPERTDEEMRALGPEGFKPDLAKEKARIKDAPMSPQKRSALIRKMEKDLERWEQQTVWSWLTDEEKKLHLEGKSKRKSRESTTLPENRYEPEFADLAPATPEGTLGSAGAAGRPIVHGAGIENIRTAMQMAGAVPGGGAHSEYTEFWRDWYTYANKDAEALAKKYADGLYKGVTMQTVAGLIAALSPNSPWNDNVRAAEQMLIGQGQRVIDYRKRLDEKLAESHMARVFPDAFEDPVTLGSMGYANNIRKAQRIIDNLVRTGADEYELGETRVCWADPPMKDPEKSSTALSVVKRENRDWAWMNVDPDEAERRFEASQGRAADIFYLREDSGRSPGSWKKGREMPVFDEDAGQMIIAGPVSGPKVEAFAIQIGRPEEFKKDSGKVVLDGHAINLYRGDYWTNLSKIKKPKPEEWDRIEKAYKQVAEEYGMQPQEVQAVTWEIWRQLLLRHRAEERAKKKTTTTASWNRRGGFYLGELGGAIFRRRAVTEVAEQLKMLEKAIVGSGEAIDPFDGESMYDLVSRWSGYFDQVTIEYEEMAEAIAGDLAGWGDRLKALVERNPGVSAYFDQLVANPTVYPEPLYESEEVDLGSFGNEQTYLPYDTVVDNKSSDY